MKVASLRDRQILADANQVELEYADALDTYFFTGRAFVRLAAWDKDNRCPKLGTEYNLVFICLSQGSSTLWFCMVACVMSNWFAAF